MIANPHTADPSTPPSTCFTRSGSGRDDILQTRNLGDIIIYTDFGGEVSFAPHSEVSADERFEVAIEDLVHVADFDAGAEVFCHAVGLENVAANLRAEFDVELGVFDFLAAG